MLAMHQAVTTNGPVCGSSCDDEVPDTVPSPGTTKLVIEDKETALFISIEWAITASVGAHVLGRSSPTTAPHTVPYIKRWSRQLIRQNKERLRRLGVDAPSEYVRLGGVLKDLDD